MLAFLTNLNFTEMAIVLVGAIMVFGKDLPRVVMRGLQHLARLRKSVTAMWREAGLEQEFKRVKAEIQPELTEIASARKSIADGKDLLKGPVSNWRKNIGLELDDVVEVGSTVVEESPSQAEPKPDGDESSQGEAAIDSTSPPEPPASTLDEKGEPDPPKKQQ
ncbi:MAG: hypothetical protein P1V35_13445 [Planctomycetota bacterium]|nr:hypothetical protein [Planctomycetota bacterium]